jgi:predicted DNA-binding protein
MRTKNEQVGFRLSADLKRELHEIAKREGRTLSQICEIFVSGGMEAYRKEGSKYVQRLFSHQNK